MRGLVEFLNRFLLFVAFLFLAACAPSKSESQRERSSELTVPAAPISNHAVSDSRIRWVDFGNFDYPLSNRGIWKLRNGRYEGRAHGNMEDYPVALAYLAYGDVTSDGVEEALVVLFENVKGTAIPYYVYIYASGQPSPKLLWIFETGDRADGGLRQVYAQDGELIVEIYGKGTVVGGKLYGSEQVGACCPRSFTRSRYVWNRSQFQIKGEPETLPNDSRGAPVLMPKYHHP